MDVDSPPEPPSRCPAQLDSQCYPHLLDAIVSFSQPPALLAFRACSRALRKHADILLFAHVEVTLPSHKAHDDDPYKVYPDNMVDVAVRPFGSNLHFEWLRSRNHPLEPDGTVSYCNLKARSALRAYMRTRMMDARIIDIPRPRFALAPMGAVDVLLEALEVKGVYDHTLVRFMGPKLQSDAHCWYSDKYLVQTHGTQVLFDDVSGVHSYKRMVRAFRCHPGDLAATNSWLSFCLPASLHHTEDPIIFHLLADIDAPRSKRKPRTSYTFVHRLLLELCRSPIVVSPFITIVGGAKECRESLHMPITATSEELIEAIETISAITPLRNHMVSVEELRSRIRPGLRFLTPAQYEAEVGAEQVAMETKFDPFTGPPASYIE